jgi:hypothetical protein
MRFAKSVCEFATWRNVLSAAPLASLNLRRSICHAIQLRQSVSRRRLCVDAATFESLSVRVKEWPIGSWEISTLAADLQRRWRPAWRYVKTLWPAQNEDEIGWRCRISEIGRTKRDGGVSTVLRPFEHPG